MKILVWQWGRRGAGPRYAAALAAGFAEAPGVEVALSLSSAAELLQTEQAPQCDLLMRTYAGLAGYVGRMAALPALAWSLSRWLRRERIELAICAMPAAMDPVMAAALRLARVPFLVVVHDADLHPGDRFPVQIALQRALVRLSAGVVALSGHVGRRLRERGLREGHRLIRSSLPPFSYGAPPPPPRAHGGPLRLLSFGRLLPYKGLDLLCDGLERLGPRTDLVVRVVGSGPESPALDRLRRVAGVTVENRWVDEAEVASLFAWADALVLSHREASQSGVVATALAAGRWVLATEVGGLAEQLDRQAGGLVCRPDAASLADGLRVLLARPAAAPAIQAGPAWSAIAAELAAELRQVQLGRK